MMGKQLALVGIAAGLCLRMTCTISPPGGGGLFPPQDVALDQATALIDIMVEDVEADVIAEIEDRFGRTVELTAERTVEVNGEPLGGPISGLYAATVDRALSYTVTVREPTRGVQSTVVQTPVTFQIVAPAEGGGASLSGFTVQWTPAETDVEVQIRLRQEFAGKTNVEWVGPFADVGSRALTAEDLRSFVQGAALRITVERARVKSGVLGFRDGTAWVRVSAERNAFPGP